MRLMSKHVYDCDCCFADGDIEWESGSDITGEEDVKTWFNKKNLDWQSSENARTQQRMKKLTNSVSN